mgnify:FL=1|tara:strand:- start:63 stop:659 length:597 start_codon:yes stop_codon:yes gene_type:complete
MSLSKKKHTNIKDLQKDSNGLLYQINNKELFTGSVIWEGFGGIYRKTEIKDGRFHGKDIYYLNGLDINYPSSWENFHYPLHKNILSETNWINGIKHGLDYHHGIDGTEVYPYKQNYKNGELEGVQDSFYYDDRSQHIWKNSKLIEIRMFENPQDLQFSSNKEYKGFVGEYEGYKYLTVFKNEKDIFEWNYRLERYVKC